MAEATRPSAMLLSPKIKASTVAAQGKSTALYMI